VRDYQNATAEWEKSQGGRALAERKPLQKGKRVGDPEQGGSKTFREETADGKGGYSYFPAEGGSVTREERESNLRGSKGDGMSYRTNEARAVGKAHAAGNGGKKNGVMSIQADEGKMNKKVAR